MTKSQHHHHPPSKRHLEMASSALPWRLLVDLACPWLAETQSPLAERKTREKVEGEGRLIVIYLLYFKIFISNNYYFIYDTFTIIKYYHIVASYKSKTFK